MSRTIVEFVLVRPARAANVAAACRALKNFGFGPPRLVGSSPGPLAASDRALAYGAWDLLDAAARFESLADAVADVHWVVATSGRAEARAIAPRPWAERLRVAPPARLAVVFGPESSGLELEELRLCSEFLRIPTQDAQPSLNLAQAVLVVAYELRQVLGGDGSPATTTTVSALDTGATVAEIEQVLDLLREGLLGIGYLNPQGPTRILAELRRLLARARPTVRELTLLRGMARQISWVAGRMGNRGRSSSIE